jgi:hypothetical protein
MKAKHFGKLVNVTLKENQLFIADSFDESNAITIICDRGAGASYLLMFCAAKFACTHVNKTVAFGCVNTAMIKRIEREIENFIPNGFIDYTRRSDIFLRNGSKIKFFSHTARDGECLRGFSLDCVILDNLELKKYCSAIKN